MHKLMTRGAIGFAATIGLATVAAAFASGGAAAATSPTTTVASTASSTTTTLAPPAQGASNHRLFMYVDTVNGGNYKPAGDCAMTNLFQPGQTVVFRMDGIQVATGGTDLTSANVLNAFVKIPGQPNQKLYFGNHGKNSYWTAGWVVPKTYPLGVVNFSVWVTTKAVPATATSKAIGEQTGTFSQAGLAPPSQLTIVKA